MAVRKGLGRGLDLLIPKDEGMPKKSTEKNKENKEPKENQVLTLSIHDVEPNRNQPRKQFDEDAIEELADSIKQYGVIQPLIVQKKDKYYEIIAGERRWRACKKAGLKEVPVIIKNYDEKETLKISLIENLQREDLNPIEEAKAYEQLYNTYGLKQDEIAASVSKSRTAITNIMRLLKLDERVQNMVIENLISSGHGRTLLSIDDGDMQYQLAEKILDENLSVREAEKLVKCILEHKDNKKNVEEESSQEKSMIDFFENKDVIYESLEEKMKGIMGTKVHIQRKKNNKGKIEIEYYSKDELERIIDLIQSIKE